MFSSQSYEKWVHMSGCQLEKGIQKLLLETVTYITITETLEKVMCIIQCRKHHPHNCNRDSHLHNYNKNCHPHIRCRNCHLHKNCK